MPPSVTRMVAIDIDGTLLPSSGTTISERNCRALRSAEAAGVHIVIATGRRHGYATPVVSQAGLSEESIMISSNGSVVRNFAGELMSRTLLPIETARALCAPLRSFGQTMVFTFDREGPEGLVVENAGAVHQQISKWVEANLEFITQIVPLERAFESGESPIQGMMCGTIARVREAELALESQFLPSALAMHRTEYPDRDLGILDLLPPGCSKGTTLRRLAQSHGIDRQEVMAIGDNFNDVEMLNYAGQPILMANASEEMQALACQNGWGFASSNDEDGVALVIEEALRRNAAKVTSESEVTSRSADEDQAVTSAW